MGLFSLVVRSGFTSIQHGPKMLSLSSTMPKNRMTKAKYFPFWVYARVSSWCSTWLQIIGLTFWTRFRGRMGSGIRWNCWERTTFWSMECLMKGWRSFRTPQKQKRRESCTFSIPTVLYSQLLTVTRNWTHSGTWWEQQPQHLAKSWCHTCKQSNTHST